MARSPITDRVVTEKRRCEVCHRPSAMSSLCKLHRRQRGKYGHAKLTSTPIFRRTRKTWLAIIPTVRQWLKLHPPPQEVLDRTTSLWKGPHNPPNRHLKYRHKTHVLRRELLWQNDSRSRKRGSHARWPWSAKRQYDPDVLLTHLLAVYVMVGEMERAFPADAEACAVGRVWGSLWKRPKTAGGSKRPLRPTTMRLFAERIRAAVGSYLLTSSRAISAYRLAEQSKVQSKPHRIVWPATVIATDPDGTQHLADQTGYVFQMKPKPPAPPPKPKKLPLSAIRRVISRTNTTT